LSAKSARALVGARRELAARPDQKAGPQLVGRRAPPLEIESAGDAVGELARLNLHVRPFGAVCLGHRAKDRGKAGHAVAIGGREISAGEERSLVGREKDRERPPPRAAHELDDELVDVIEIRTFLAVDLDRDEIVVHLASDIGVLERLALHDVAPVARGVANRQNDGLVLRSGLGQGLGTPGVPIDGITGVLLEVR
jgi:hypothetical protein